MSLSFVRHEKLSLKSHPDFQEAWIHNQIVNDTALLGLGELDLIQRERPQYSGGRLDILLADTEQNVRYEVEVMLGATDPSHIIRCIEYWDVERRMYPAYDHVAVIVAEEVTTRFLNVMGLLAGSIPLIAIQLNALKVNESILLDFVKVLDQRALREDDTIENGGEEDVDRSWWESKKGADKVQVCDRLLTLVQEETETTYELRFRKGRISISPTSSFFHVVACYPKLKFVRTNIKISDTKPWITRLEEVGLDADSPREGRLRLRLTLANVDKHEGVLRELLHHAVHEAEV